jgi:hypothetical protein
MKRNEAQNQYKSMSDEEEESVVSAVIHGRMMQVLIDGV